MFKIIFYYPPLFYFKKKKKKLEKINLEILNSGHKVRSVHILNGITGK